MTTLFEAAIDLGDQFTADLERRRGMLADAEFIEGDLVGDGLFRPPKPVLAVGGNLRVEGDLLVQHRGVDGATLVVLGDLACENLCLGYGATVLVAGKLEVSGLCFTSVADAIFNVYGPVRIGSLYSGNGGGWLTAFTDDVEVGALDSYVQDGRTRSGHAINSSDARGSLEFVDEVLDFDEWDSFPDEEQQAVIESSESKYDYAVVDEQEIYERFEKQKPVLRS